MSWGEPQQPYPGQGGEPNGPYGPAYPQPPYQNVPPNPAPQTRQAPQTPQMPPTRQMPQGGWTAPQPFGAGPGYTQPEFATYPPQGQGPKKGNGLFIGVVVGALLVVGGGITAAALLTGKHGGGPTPGATSTVVAAGTDATPADTASPAASGTASAGSQISAPSGVSGLTRLQGSVADHAVSSMKQNLAGEAEMYPAPVLAAYNDAGGTDVTTIFVDEPTDKLSAADQESFKSAGSPDDVVNEIMTAAGVSDAQSESTSADNGALSCGTKNESGTDVTICVWYDGTTFGSLQYLDGTSADDAAPVADAMRAAAEN